MTRDVSDLIGVEVYGSDHLTAYNVYAEAVNQCGYLGQVHRLPRHLFVEEIDEWAEARGVLVKAIEDIALGMASVYRTLEIRLPESLPMANRDILRRFQDLVARVMPFDLVVEGETAAGDRVRVSSSSVCSSRGAIAGTLRYFADRFGVPRGAIEGTSLPFELIKRYAERGDPTVEFREGRKRAGLFVTRATEYSGFVLDSERRPLDGTFPAHLHAEARRALAQALMNGSTPHPNRRSVSRAAARLSEYWRRSGGKLPQIRPSTVRRAIQEQLSSVRSWDDFIETPVELDEATFLPEETREGLDALPNSAVVFGVRVPLEYELEGDAGVVRLRLREKQARRLRERDLPCVDQPIRFSVFRGRREVVRAASLGEMQNALDRLPATRQPQRRRRYRRR
jgi:hypothetical protein